MRFGVYYHDVVELADWCHWCPVCNSLSYDYDEARNAVLAMGEDWDPAAAVLAMVRTARTLGHEPEAVCEFAPGQWEALEFGACVHNGDVAGIYPWVVEVVGVT